MLDVSWIFVRFNKIMGSIFGIIRNLWATVWPDRVINWEMNLVLTNDKTIFVAFCKKSLLLLIGQLWNKCHYVPCRFTTSINGCNLNQLIQATFKLCFSNYIKYVFCCWLALVLRSIVSHCATTSIENFCMQFFCIYQLLHHWYHLFVIATSGFHS